jgi:hypothetical protein
LKYSHLICVTFAFYCVLPFCNGHPAAFSRSDRIPENLEQRKERSRRNRKYGWDYGTGLKVSRSHILLKYLDFLGFFI